MTEPTPDDELLAILLVNLRNAEATFGQGTPPYETIQTTVKEHLESMKARVILTNLTGVRRQSQPSAAPEKPASTTFANLAFRPKPST
ncbi:hypothetical protein LTR09_006991 [Extremus antarcticus]|uniref:Uncharacterized protein n=1 Tax=Extremus antarcticus TaxID=702011 RepID=A0AAJ0DDK8_9PEZI|nr:hypothetical protein LTR09_006991 [Extremus antarcticus]